MKWNIMTNTENSLILSKTDFLALICIQHAIHQIYSYVPESKIHHLNESLDLLDNLISKFN